MPRSPYRIALRVALCSVALSFVFTPRASAQDLLRNVDVAGSDPKEQIIYACVKGDGLGDRDPDDGRLVRLVAVHEDCRHKETKIHWNVKGPTGPQGPQGPEGPRGPAGPQGPPGRDTLAGTVVNTVPNCTPGANNTCTTTVGVNCPAGTLVVGCGTVLSNICSDGSNGISDTFFTITNGCGARVYNNILNGLCPTMTFNVTVQARCITP